MPSFGPISTSGEGHATLPAAEPVSSMQLRVTTLSVYKSRQVGIAAPVGLWHIGQAGVGSFPDDVWATNPAIELASKFIHAMNESWVVFGANVGVFYAPSIWWRWLPGNVVEITVFW